MNFINNFIKKVGLRLWTNSCLRLFGRISIFTTITILILSLFFIFQGQAVDRSFILPIAIFAIVSLAVAALLRYPKKHESSAFADRFFEINDALTSVSDFNENEGESEVEKQFKQLHLKQTIELCSKQDVTRIAINLPIRSVAVSLLLLLISSWLYSFNDSPSVRQNKLEKLTIEEASKASKKLIQLELTKLEESLNEKEKELYSAKELREMVERLRSTSDKKDALKQYAKLEQKVNELTERMKLRDDEKLLAELAKKLQKNRDSEKLGELLSKNSYKKATKELDKLKNCSSLSLKQQKKMADKLKQMAKQMKNTADQLKANQSTLKKNIASLSKASDAMQKALKRAMQEMIQNQSVSQECQQKGDKSRKESNNSLSEMIEGLKKIGTKSSFQKKMKAMKNALSNAQRMIAKPGRLLQGAQKKAGMGSVASKNQEAAYFLEPGYDTQLQGVKGQGKSVFQVEDSQSGSGVSQQRISKTRKIDFKKQVESFIGRNDIPQPMKNGVKAYFKTVHEQGE